jgi:hypothetical protein
MGCRMCGMREGGDKRMTQGTTRAAESGAKGQIFGTLIFGPALAQKGYALNKMCFSFNNAANRAEFLTWGFRCQEVFSVGPPF